VRGIPYRIYKGSSFYDHKEVKDVLAYIRLVINPRDDEAFKRVVNYPARGVGQTTIERIGMIAAERKCSMWEAVDTLVSEAEQIEDKVQKVIARKVAEFVSLIRSFAEKRVEMPLYDFGLEVATRTGILAEYRQEKTPENQSAIDNIEELLNTMQLFTEQREAEIRGGERGEDEVATLEEWLQSLMLLTDMDQKEEENEEKLTLMTVHSAKGLEYKYVFIVGCEENLFPSQRAIEEVDGVEEERRLFYVALTRAERCVMLSYCEMRFKWGEMSFSAPSRFLSEIDSRYVDIDEALRRPSIHNQIEEDEPRASFTRPQVARRSFGTPQRTYGSSTQPKANGKSSIDELRKKFDIRFQQKREQGGEPNPTIIRHTEPQRSTEGLRRVATGAAGATSQLPPCQYAVGEWVEHPKFGRGEVLRIEAMATDYKVVIAFRDFGEKTLLAKFAKLTKL
jgi:DNA helicase-2/ATP-dependent DNA helicase PcrA